MILIFVRKGQRRPCLPLLYMLCCKLDLPFETCFVNKDRRDKICKILKKKDVSMFMLKRKGKRCSTLLIMI